MIRDCGIWLFILAASVTAQTTTGSRNKTLLDQGWALQSSAEVKGGGAVISTTGFRPEKWYPATVPSTVVGTLVTDKVYPDPFFGMNLRSIPGTSYAIGTNFTNLEMPQDSPFRVSWWYRKEFVPPAGENVFLHFDGINFRANIWVNGKRIADSKQVAGAYRMYEFDITPLVVRGKPNVLAVEVFPPTPRDLAITWVDWNPMPPDKNMGIWRDAYLTSTSGPVALRYPQIITKVDVPSLATARLTVSGELRNPGKTAVRAALAGRIGQILFSQDVELAAGETKLVTFTPDKFPQLVIAKPRLWWPVQLGAQNLYDLSLEARVAGRASDQESLRFGIREVTSELTPEKYRVFRVNGQRVLIRGGGWAPDLFLRPSAERELAEIRYVKDMNLNTIRFEAKTESRRFLEACDREGILVMARWCCCDHWERWKQWDGEDQEIAVASLRDQIRRLRNHPSLLVWLNGSDNPPPADVERKYLEVLKNLNWPNPSISSATAAPTEVSERSGVRMTGPYDYVPPSYWYVDTKRGGAYSFNTETSSGPAIPPVESLRKMLPPDHLWPIDQYWEYHAGGGVFKNIRLFTEALTARYGKPAKLEDFVWKAQLMAYEGQRAMFEAYARNKYHSTGVIQWMMNNAWPSLIWHLYDYYLRPAAGYFGTKKACEPLHVQYSYDDRSVVVINSQAREFKGLRASATVYNLDMTEKFSQKASVDAGPDSSNRILTIPEIKDLSTTYFVRLGLEDSAGKLVSSNFYWLSTRSEVLDDAKGQWYYTPVKQFADFTAMNSMPQVELKVSASASAAGKEQVARVTMENPSKNLAFFVRLKVTNGAGGEEFLPVIWQDNYLALMPGERREVTATYQAGSAKPAVEVDGWNITPRSYAVKF
jgi:exo-1,4-beta-D-glucosaminidase